MNLLTKFVKPVYAHCDVPCGIYETDTLVHAAETCVRMTEKIAALDVKGEKTDEHNNFIRMVVTKEKHAQLAKDQIYILWSDYFKPEHLQKIPDLHDTMWQTAKQCSKVKQSISTDEAHKLLTMAQHIASIFKESKA